MSYWVVEQLQHPKASIKSQFLWAGFFASSSEIYSPRRNTEYKRLERTMHGGELALNNTSVSHDIENIFL